MERACLCRAWRGHLQDLHMDENGEQDGQVEAAALHVILHLVSKFPDRGLPVLHYYPGFSFLCKLG